jgi:hypothetical protein
LIFIILGLDSNRVIYLGIFLGLDSFRSPPSTWIDPFYLTQIQLHLLVESVLYKVDVAVYKRSLTRSKEASLSCMFCPARPPYQSFTRSDNSLPDFLPGHSPGFLLEIVPDYLPELLPGTFPESYPDTYPIRLTWPYPSSYPAS